MRLRRDVDASARRRGTATCPAASTPDTLDYAQLAQVADSLAAALAAAPATLGLAERR